MRVPYKCPVCNGAGTLPPNPNVTSTAGETCRACKGEGIVWSLDVPAEDPVIAILVRAHTVLAKRVQAIERRMQT